MAQLDFQLPLDQPTDRKRLLERLRAQFDSGDFIRLRLIVAFARIGPLHKFINQIDSWAESDYDIDAIFGIDLRNTSAEALAFALEHFNEVRIVHQRDDSVTFHPKIYLFEGADRAYAYIGSNNLTVGGTESNFEAGVGTLMDLTDDGDLAIYEELCEGWAETKDISLGLTKDRLRHLIAQGKVLLEKEMWASSTHGTSSDDGEEGKELEKDRLDFPQTDVGPTESAPVQRSSELPTTDAGSPNSAIPATAETALVMEVKPRNNGEVHLSVKAAKQNPEFFGRPFSGTIEPRKEENEPYPQRDPKPISNVRLYDEEGDLAVRAPNFEMKMWDYKGNGEIRIMVPTEVKNYGNLKRFDGPEYCVLVMERKPSPMPQEYDVSIYLPGSSKHRAYRQLCDKTMPAGGKEHPRSYGWLE